MFLLAGPATIGRTLECLTGCLRIGALRRYRDNANMSVGRKYLDPILQHPPHVALFSRKHGAARLLLYLFNGLVEGNFSGGLIREKRSTHRRERQRTKRSQSIGFQCHADVIHR